MPHDTFAALLNKKLVISSQKTSYLAVDRAFFSNLLAHALGEIDVDEVWYLRRSPDVQDAIEKAEFASARDHYVKVGFYEHRMPYEIEVDEEWYLANYSDIATAVQNGVFESGKAHFYQLGFSEGRFPHPNFALRTAC